MYQRTWATDPVAKYFQRIAWRTERLKRMPVREFTFLEQRRYLDEQMRLK